jgi:uncharacterized protein with NRDE domain
MCSTIILSRPGHDWPILIAANRDERRGRAWEKPGLHWPDRPGVVAGLDILAGGSWLGVNAAGVAAAVLNRANTLGPEADKRSRGELVLDALDHVDAADAADALGALEPGAYRPFNLVIADNRDAFLLVHRGGEDLAVERLPAGLSFITAMDRDDPGSPRIRRYRPEFVSAAPPDPDSGDWSSWEKLLGDRDREPGSGPGGALFIDAGDFGTVSSSLIALPGIDHPNRVPIWRFASGMPERWDWETISVPIHTSPFDSSR